MTILDKFSDLFLSRRVAYDFLYRGRSIEPDDMWWLDIGRETEREELKRAKQAKAQSDRDPFDDAQRIAFAAAIKK